MGAQRWIYVLLIVVGVALGLVIAGMPSQRSDPPLRVIPTTTAPATAPPS